LVNINGRKGNNNVFEYVLLDNHILKNGFT
jgi:hypothetical protein